MKSVAQVLRELLNYTVESVRALFRWKESMTAAELERIDSIRIYNNIRRSVIFIFFLIIFQISNLSVDIKTNAHPNYSTLYYLGEALMMVACLFYLCFFLVHLRKISPQRMTVRGSRILIIMFWLSVSLITLYFNALDLLERESLNNFWAVVAMLALLPLLSLNESLLIFAVVLAGQIGITLLLGTPAFLVQQCILLLVIAFALNQMFFRSSIMGQLSQYRLKIASETDPLSGLYNRRGLDHWLDDHEELIHRYGDIVTSGFIDIDLFKTYNDTYGHIEGDQCVCAVCGQIRDYFSRFPGVVCRFGGDEIIVILLGMDQKEAYKHFHVVKEKIERKKISGTAHPTAGSVTVSIGYSTKHVRDKTDIWDLISSSDSALYSAKTNGRNRVSLWCDDI